MTETGPENRMWVVVDCRVVEYTTTSDVSGLQVVLNSTAKSVTSRGTKLAKTHCHLVQDVAWGTNKGKRSQLVGGCCNKHLETR